MSEHTPTPWSWHPNDDQSYGDESVAGYISEADGRRIVACVNACVGFDTQQLEEAPALKHLARTLDSTARDLARTEQQRDELLAALEDARNVVVNLATSDGDKFTKEALCAIVDRYDAAIARVRS